MRYIITVWILLMPFLAIAQSENILFEKSQVRFNENKFTEIVNELNGVITLISPAIHIKIKNPEPFLGIAFKLYGYGLKEENIFVEFKSDFDDEWILFEFDDDVENPDGELTSGLQFFNKSTKSVHFKMSFTGNKSNFEKIDINFISPGKTPDEILSNLTNYEPQIQFTPNIEISKNRKQIFDVTKTELVNSYPRPPIVTRTEWGCPQGQGSLGSPSLTSPSHLIVHHSAGTSSSNDWPAVVRAIYTLHTQSNGWSDIGYNWLIDANGVVYQGRAWWQNTNDNVLGAHFCGKNSSTMGVCVMGTYTSASPTEAAKTSLTEILAYKTDERNINPLGSGYHISSGLTLNNISGHRNGCATECPGTNLYNQLPDIRNRVYDLLNPTSVDDDGIIADDFYLAQNYPNPFNPVTILSWQSSVASWQVLKVFDLLGNDVAILVNEFRPAGNYQIEFDASGLSSGVYFYSLTAEGNNYTRKMILLQ